MSLSLLEMYLKHCSRTTLCKNVLVLLKHAETYMLIQKRNVFQTSTKIVD